MCVLCARGDGCECVCVGGDSEGGVSVADSDNWACPQHPSGCCLLMCNVLGLTGHGVCVCVCARARACEKERGSEGAREGGGIAVYKFRITSTQVSLCVVCAYARAYDDARVYLCRTRTIACQRERATSLANSAPLRRPS